MNEEILKVKVVVDTSAARRPLQQFQRDVKSSSTEVANMDRRFLSMGNTLRGLRNFSFKNLFSPSGFQQLENSVKSIDSAFKNVAVGSAAAGTALNKTGKNARDFAGDLLIAGVGARELGSGIQKTVEAGKQVKSIKLGEGFNVKTIQRGTATAETSLAKLGKTISNTEYKLYSFIDSYSHLFKEVPNYKELEHMVDIANKIHKQRGEPYELKADAYLAGTLNALKDKVHWTEEDKKAVAQLLDITKKLRVEEMTRRKLALKAAPIYQSGQTAQKYDPGKFRDKLPDFNRQIRPAYENIRQITDESNKISKIWGSMPAKIAAVVGIVAELVVAIKTIKTSIEVANAGTKIQDEANKALMSFKAYQEWGYVLQQNGIEQKQLATAMKTFGALLENNAESLKKYGITSKNVNEAFGQAVYYIQGLSTQTEKLTAAQELFGKRVASELMPVLNMNKAQTQDLMRTYELLGGTMSNYLVVSSHTLTDNITHLKAAFAGVKNTIAEAFIPAITKVVQWLTVLIAKIRIVLQALLGVGGWINKIKGKMSDAAKGAGGKGGIGGLADGANATADGLKKANKQAEKLRRYLIGIDELNVMPDKNKAAGSDSTGGTPDVGGIGDLGDMGGSLMDGFDNAMLDKIEAFKEKIKGLKDIIRVATPIILMGAGAMLAALGVATMNIPLAIAGFGLAGIGLAIGKANGTWDELIQAPVKFFKKHKAAIVVAIGTIAALLGMATANIPLAIGGIAIAGIGLAMNTKQNKGWSKLGDDISSMINHVVPIITGAIGVFATILGFMTLNPVLIAAGGLIAGFSIAAIKSGGWGNLLSDITSKIKDFASGIKEKAADIWNSIKEFVLGIPEKIKNAFKDFKLSDYLPQMGNWELFKNIDFDKVKDALSKIAEIAKKIILPDFSGLSALKDLAGNKIASIKIKFSDTKEKLKDKWKDLTGHIKDKTAKFKAKIEAKKEQLKAAWNKVVEGIKGKAVAIGVKIKAAKDVIKQWWSDVKDKLKVGTIELGVKIKDKWEDIKDAWQKNIIDKAQGAKVKIETYIGTKWSDIKDSWNELKKNMDGHKANIKVGIPKWSNLSFAWAKLMKKFKDKTVNMKLKITATVSNMKAWVNTNLIDKINSKLKSTKLFSSIQIPRLAKGGVLTAPTMALMGEYPGANNNPEIVAPQSILKETVISANGELANVFIQMSRQIVNAIENKEMDVRIGDDAIARSAARGNQNFRLATGKNIF